MGPGPAVLAIEVSVRLSAARWEASHPSMTKAPVSGWWEGFWEDDGSAVAEDDRQLALKPLSQSGDPSEKVCISSGGMACPSRSGFLGDRW